MNKLLLLLIVVSVFFLNLNAQLYVLPNGDDNNIGTLNFPFRSVTLAELLIDKGYEENG